MNVTIDNSPRKNSLSNFVNIDEANASSIRLSNSKQQTGNPLLKSHSAEITVKHHTPQVAFSMGDINEIMQDIEEPTEDPSDKLLPIAKEKLGKAEKIESESSDSIFLLGQLGLLDDAIINDFELMSSMQIHPEEICEKYSPIKPILCVDLDETLVHTVPASAAKSYTGSGYSIGYKMEGFYLMLRPYLPMFLQEMRKYYELRIFTSSEEGYATQIIKKIDESGTLFAKKYFRPSCRLVGGRLVKDLRVAECDLRRVVLIDNSVLSFCLQLSNGVYIKSFYGSAYDTELISYINLLKEIAVCDDVRQNINEKWNLSALLKYYREMF
jgi:Dullard-like phosphatase family protein